MDIHRTNELLRTATENVINEERREAYKNDYEAYLDNKIASCSNEMDWWCYVDKDMDYQEKNDAD